MTGIVPRKKEKKTFSTKNKEEIKAENEKKKHLHAQKLSEKYETTSI